MGAVIGPTLGMFLMGGLSRHANWKVGLSHSLYRYKEMNKYSTELEQ